MKELFYLLNLNETLPNIKVEWSEESETNTQGELLAGESINSHVKIKLNPDFDYPDNLEIPIYLEVISRMMMEGRDYFCCQQRLLITE